MRQQLEMSLNRIYQEMGQLTEQIADLEVQQLALEAQAFHNPAITDFAEQQGQLQAQIASREADLARLTQPYAQTQHGLEVIEGLHGPGAGALRLGTIAVVGGVLSFAGGVLGVYLGEQRITSKDAGAVDVALGTAQAGAGGAEAVGASMWGVGAIAGSTELAALGLGMSAAGGIVGIPIMGIIVDVEHQREFERRVQAATTPEEQQDVLDYEIGWAIGTTAYP
jgi:hypothetical protein